MTNTKTLPLQPCNHPTFDFEAIESKRESLSLRPYQERNLGFILSQKRSGDLSEAGTGKSPVAALWIYEHSTDKKVIWVMPKSLMVKNYYELLLWSILTPDQVTIVDGNPTQRGKQISHPNTRVFIMGFECFARNWESITKSHPDSYHLAVDEHHLGFATHYEQNWMTKKGVGAKRTSDFYRFLQRGGNLLSMTGTMINGRLNSAYPWISVINPNYYPTYASFMVWHSLMDTYGNPVYWKNHDRLQKIINKHSCRTTFEEAYGSEKKQIFIQMCTMSDPQYKAYKEIEQRGITEIEDDYLEADNPAVGIAYCFSIMQTPEKYGFKPHPTDSKEEHVKTILEDHKETGKPLVIFEKSVDCHYKYAEFCKAKGLTHAIMNGSEKADRGILSNQFENSKIQVMICSPAVAGIGFNWGHLDHIVFASIDWQDSTFIQNYRRAMRGVRDSILKITVLVYQGGLDKPIARKLKTKSEDRLKIEEGVSVDLLDLIIAAD